MFKMIIALAVASVMASAGGNIAVAEVVAVPWTGVYVGAGATANQTYVVDNSDWFTTSNLNKTAYGVEGNLGYTFFNNGSVALSAEGRVGTSLAGDDFVETVYYAAYVKPEYIFDTFSVYGLLGYGNLDYTRTEGSEYVEYAVTKSVDGFTWGLGAQYAISDRVSLFADYVVQPSLDRADIGENVIAEDSIETDVITAGFNYRF